MEIKGEIGDIIYRNEINSYTVATLINHNEENIIVGYIPFVNKGDMIKAIGNFVEHKEYGRQFKVETFEKIMPETTEALEKYLANGFIKGVGKAIASRIVNRFGDDTINVLKFEPEKLSTIKGISKEKAIEIGNAFIENWEVWQIVGYLEKFGIGPQNAQVIFKKYGVNTKLEIENNPYLLVDLLNKVNFKQIDDIAIKIGTDLDDPKRILSGIKYALKLATYNGHCTVLYENLLQFAKELLRVNEDSIEDCLINMKGKEDIVIEERENQEWVYLAPYYKAEMNIANSLISLDNYRNVKQIDNFDRKLKKVEKSSNIELSDKQKEAVRAVNDHNVCIITGGPGTGKTTTIKTIIEMYKNEERKVALCAPTGRAAKRMTETTGEEAKTLHRLLELGKIVVDENQDPDIDVAPIDADVIIVDELSMVDLFLMNYLVKAIFKGTKLVLVGDVDQLPSVGPGNVLKDLINSERITTITLNKIFRQAAKSKIIVNSHKVNDGINFLEEVDNNEEFLDDFFYINESNQNKILDNILSLSTGRLKKYGDYDFLKNIQIITPTKKGLLGTKELNKMLQEKINPESDLKKEKEYRDVIFREGDRIMQIKNNYDIYWEKDNITLEVGKGVFNGEYGTIMYIDENEKQIKIKFDDEKVAWYQFSELEQIEHAYSITVHKAQRE